MKIAIYHNLSGGGGSRAFDEIIKRLKKRHQLDLYQLKEKPKNKFIPFQLFIYTRLFKIQQELASKIDQKGYDCVLLTHDYLTKSPLLLRYLKTASVYLCHEAFREFYELASIFANSLKYKIVNLLRLPIKIIDEKNVAKASIVAANSNYSQKNLTKIYQRKIEKISLGVDTVFFKDLKLKRENFYLTVAPLARFKGVDFIIKGISCLPKKYQYPLLAAGSGGRDKKYIINLAKKMGVVLKIKPNLNDFDLVKLYNKAKLMLYAPYYEPFGLAALEAMACGLPVIGISEGGLNETIINGQNGWLSIRNEKEYSQNILKALKTVNQKFRNNTRKSVQNWTWDKSALMLEKILYKTIISKNRVKLRMTFDK